MSAAQLTLHFEHRVAMSDEDFLVSESNAEAVAWIDRWPEWPAPALVVHGPPGCGKTHLVQVWRARSGGPTLSAGALTRTDPHAILGGCRHCAVEAADAGVDARALLHLYNVVAERRGTMLLTAEAPPSRWTIDLPDLRSRLLTAPAVGVGPPDDALISAVIVKLFSDRQIQVRQDVIEYFMRHRERSFAAARQFVAVLDQGSLSRGRPITAALARDLYGRSDMPDGSA